MEQQYTYSQVEDIGICNVTYNDNQLGLTKGGVTVATNFSYFDRTADAHGDSLLERYKRGCNIQVTVPMLQQATAHMAYYNQDGTTSGTEYTFGQTTGGVLSGYLLVLEPKSSGALDLVIYRAVPDPTGTFTYSDNNEWIQSCVFHGTIDTSRTNNDLMYKWATSYSWSSSSVSKSQ